MKPVLKYSLLVYFFCFLHNLNANIPGNITSVMITDSIECHLSDYTIEFELLNDGNTGNSAANVGAFMSIIFPGGTITDNVTGANLIFGNSSYPVNNLALNPGSILFQIPIALPALASFSIEVFNINNPPFNVNCGNPNTYSSGVCGDILAALQNLLPGLSNCYRHLNVPLYNINPSIAQVQSINVDKPNVLPVIIEGTGELMLRLRVDVCGSQGGLPLVQYLAIGPAAMPTQNIRSAKVWFGGSDPQFDILIHQMLDETFSISPQMILTTNQQLQLGENYFYITYDISCFPEILNSFVDIEFLGANIDNQTYTTSTPLGTRGISGNFVNSALNLVPNPSFEIADTCPNQNGQIHRAAFWENMNYSTTVLFQSGTPDFFHPCATNPNSSTPNNYFGTQTARTGQAYAGITGNFPNIFENKEYMSVPLTTPLLSGEEYIVSYYVSSSRNNTAGYGAKNSGFGFALETGPLPVLPNNDVFPPFPPDFCSNFVYMSETNWQLVEACVTANGGEDILVIGVFKDETNGGITVLDGASYPLYYVDDVSVIQKSLLQTECCPQQNALNFSRSQLGGSNNQGRRVHTFDVNDDGLTDILTCNDGLSHSQDGILIKYNQGLGVFSNGTAFLTGNNVVDFNYYDVTGDGREDLICQGWNDLWVLEGGGTGLTNDGTYTLISTQNINTANAPEYRGGFDFADLNGDLLNDLVVLNGNGDKVKVYYRNTNTTTPLFGDVTTGQPNVTINGPAAISYWEAKLVDLNADGLLDIHIPSGGGDNNIHVYINTGSSFDLNAVILNTSGASWPRGLEILDIDGDGQLNVITGCQFSQEVIISDNINPLTVIPGNTITPLWNRIGTGSGDPVGIDIADIDNNGLLDIGVSLYNTRKVAVIKQTAPNVFGSITEYSITGIGNNTDLEFANLNGDCCLDIVTANWAGNSASFPGSSTLFINSCDSLTYLVEGDVFCAPPSGCIGVNTLPNARVAIYDQTNATTSYTQTDANGHYSVVVPQSSIFVDITLPSSTYNSTCASTVGYPYSNIVAGNLTNMDFIVDDSCDVQVEITGSFAGSIGVNNCPFAATPCNNLIWQYCVRFSNNSCTQRNINDFVLNLPQGVSQAYLIEDLRLCGTNTSVLTGIANNVINPTQIVWSSGATFPLGAGECYEGCVTVQFGSNLGNNPTATAIANFTCGEFPSASSGVLTYMDTCSCDPNFKTVYPLGCGPNHAITPQELTYRVQFQNIGPGPAYDVRVEDLLDPNLDWSSFTLNGSSHTPTAVTIDASRKLTVEFDNIGLPPNSISWFEYKIHPKSNLLPGTQIFNDANVFFDNNASVSTNLVLSTIIQQPLSAEIIPDCPIVYLGYAPNECVDIEVYAIGGLAPYTYQWSNGANTSDINVCPQVTTSYSVTVTDDVGCTTVVEKTVHVIDISCKTNNVWVCKKKKNGSFVTRCVKVTKVPAILAAGGSLGQCDQTDPCSQLRMRSVDEMTDYTITVLPNPNRGQFIINTGENVGIGIKVYNNQGQKVFYTMERDRIYTVDMRDNPSGLYVIHVKFEDGTVRIEKVIIN